MVSALICLARTVRTGGFSRRLAQLDDHTLRDIGLRRTDLYALRHLHASRIKTACCRLRDAAFQWLAGSQPTCC